MKSRITKKVLSELKIIIDNHGYWSTNVRDFISQYEYPTSRQLHSKAQVYDKYKYGL